MRNRDMPLAMQQMWLHKILRKMVHQPFPMRKWDHQICIALVQYHWHSSLTQLEPPRLRES